MKHNRIFITTFLLLIVLLSLSVFVVPASAAPVNVSINFQDAATVPPAGYLRDSGEAFALRNGANQAGGYTYGWVNPADGTPLNLVGNGRNRNVAAIQLRQNTLIHMQANNVPGGINPGQETEGIWEIVTDNGGYSVEVSAGDAGAAVDSVHRVNVEGVLAVDFTPTAANKFSTITVQVNVNDGRLTLDAFGGNNTKINYVIIAPLAGPARPSILGTNPANNAINVAVDGSISTTSLNLPNGGLNGTTVNATTVRLYPTGQPANLVTSTSINTTGGGDAITFVPAANLTPNTNYTFEVTAQVLDGAGIGMIPFAMTFTTGGVAAPPPAGVAFTKIPMNLPSRGYTSVAIGPDNRLYAVTNTGEIYNWAIQADGLLNDEQLIGALGNRIAIGIAFQPGSTAANPIMWVSHNANVFPGPHFTGQVSRLTRTAGVWAAELKVTGLPRSVKDHLTNSLAFGPDGALYLTQGSISAMGARDNAWGQQPDTILSAAVLRINTATLPGAALNVATGTASADGNLLDANNFQLNQAGLPYNPRAANAPVTLYATGVRNAYDLVWHTNGQLYVPTNGSAGGGNSPGTPGAFATEPACTARANGAAYTGGAVPVAINIVTQEDYLFRVVQGGYYGHPNPTRCEWVLNGGNPTAGADAGQVGNHYPVGTQPDPNWRGASFNFSFNKSPNGVIEYRNATAFGGALQGTLMVVRFSQNDDIIVLQPGGPQLNIISSTTGIPGLTAFNNPLDLVENVANGSLYVVEYGDESTNADNKITLLQPGIPNIFVTPNPMPFTDVVDAAPSAPVTLTISNTGTANLALNTLTLGGVDAAQFQIVTEPGVPSFVASGASVTVTISLNAATVGAKTATYTINSSDPDTPNVVVTLNGMATMPAVAPNIALSPGMLDFTDPAGGAASAPQTVTINNTGTQPLTITGFTLGGANGAEFQIFAPATPLNVAAGASATVDVVFNPATAGAKAATLTIASNDPDTPNAVMNLTGTATNAPSNIVVAPMTLNFVDQVGGGASAPLGITINNTGTGPLTITALTLGGVNAAEFQLDTPPGLPLTIAPAGSATINVVFNSTTAGNKAATLTLVNSSANSPNAVVTLAGVASDPGAAPNIVVTPNRLVFSDGIGGAASPVRPVTITNTGAAPLTITARALGGVNANQFQMITPPAQPINIAAGASVIINIAFNPTTGCGAGLSSCVRIAALNLTGINDPDTVTVAVELRGLAFTNFNGGANEPSLQRILEAFNIPVVVGDDNAGTTPIRGNGAAYPGDTLPGSQEVAMQQLQRVGVNPVTVEVLASFANNINPVSRVGWYPIGNPNVRTQIFTVNPNTAGDNNHQSLSPKTTGILSFNPGAAPFGLYSFWPPANFNWTVFSEDALNTFDPTAAQRHKMRFYPLRDAANAVVPNAYIVATEEFTTGFDYNDVVYIVRNVQPATLIAGGNINLTNLDWVALNAQDIPQFSYVNTWLTMHRINNATTNNPNNVPLASRPPLLTHDRATLRITNTGTTPLVITRLLISDLGRFQFPNGENPSVATPLVIAPNTFYDLTVRFIEAAGTRGVRIGTLTINSSDPDSPTNTVTLAGAYMQFDEGGSEVTPPMVAQAFGYTTNLAYPFNSDYIARGDEILSFDWRRADLSRPVYVRQLAALHGCCQAEAFFTLTGPGGGTFRHDNQYGQSLLPNAQNSAVNPAQMTVYPTGNPFQFNIEGFNSAACRNVANCPAHAVRFWQVRDRNGVLIPNAYFVIQDYIPGTGCQAGDAAGICDYNDNVYLVTNIEPFNTITDIAVAITGPVAPTTGVNLNYTITASNVTTYQAASVVVTVNIPAGYTYVSATPSVGSCAAPVNNVLTCNIGTLLGNGNVTIGLVVTAATAGDYITTASIVTTTPENVLPNNQATNTVTVANVAGIPSSITIVKAATPETNQVFQFNTTGTGLSNFSLVDSGAAALNVAINFQPAGAAPAGFIVDSGQQYAARGGGRTYGWITQASVGTGTSVPLSLINNTRNRNRVGIPEELDTIIHMQYVGNAGNQTPGAWEYQLPNGTYSVTISVGDQPGNGGIYDSTNRINIEGVNVINNFVGAVPAGGSNEYRQATALVTVTDGNLTIDAIGGTNTKLDYVRIAPANTQTFSNLQPGTYTIAEVIPVTWSLLGASCTGVTATPIQNGVSMQLIGNQNVTCTFNNSNAAGPAITLDKAVVASPINSGATAQFTLTVTNTGIVDLNTIVMTDPQCTQGPTIATNGNGDVILQSNEVWTYTCAIANVLIDTINTATVSGTPVSGGQAVTATDTATVNVNPNPSIDLTKTSDNSPVTVGQSASFTLTALNTGNVPLNPVTVTDNQCNQLVQTGNGNGNANLEPGETWTWNCIIQNVNGQSITNTAQISGTPTTGGAAVVDQAQATAQIVPDGQPASIMIVKASTPETAQAFTFNTNNANNATFNLIDDGSAAPAAFQTSINFQPAASPIPAGFVVDGGLGYAARGGGATYGWITEATAGNANPTPIDIANNTRDRNRGVIVQELDTIIHMQYVGNAANGNATPSAWEYALPNGVYSVTVSVGDQPTAQGTYDSQHSVTVEGVQFLNRWQATAAQEYRQVTALVTVVDGKLTVRPTGGTNTKLNYIRIQRIQAGTNTRVITGLAPGTTVNITEAQLAGWVLTNVTCTGANGVAYVAGGANVTVGSTQNATCTFANNQVNAIIALDKAAVTTPITSGQAANFTLTVRNTGTVALNTIVMTDAQCTTGPTLRAGGDANTDTILQTTETWVYDCAIANVITDVTNTATVSGTPVSGGGQPVIATDNAVVAVTPAPAIAVDKTPVSQQIVQGATANFTLTVRNVGNVALNTIQVTDPLCSAAPVLQPGGDVNTNNIMEITETWVYICATVNVQNDFTNTVNVAGTPVAGGQAVTATDTADVVLNPNPVIAVDKTPATQQIALNATANFTITVTNPGNLALGSIVVTDPLCTTVPALQVGGDANNDTILQRTETWVYTCATANVTDPFTNTVNVSGTPANGQPVTATDIAAVTLIPSPAITVDKTPASQVLAQGATANFTITVRNVGTEPLGTIVVTDPLCNAAPVLQPGGDANNDTILQRTETWVYTCATANVQADFTNNVDVSGTPTTGGAAVTATDTALVTVVITPNPAINLVKDADQTVIQGNSAVFTLTVTNIGNVPLTGVAITDPLCVPAATLRPAGDANGNTVLETTETWIYDCIVPNVQANFVNTAKVDATDGTTPVSDTDDATVIMVQAPAPAINIAKAATTPNVFQGQPAPFTLTVTNTGNVALNAVVVTDAQCTVPPVLRVGGDANNDTILQTTETWVYDCNVDTTPTSGTLTNTATVDATDGATPVTDTATADINVVPVVAGTSILIDKSANAPTVAVGGTAMFTLIVANNGNVDVINVTLTDALCTPQRIQNGNGDEILSPTEYWVYACGVVNVLADFTNTASVAATNAVDGVTQANASDDASVTVDLSGNPLLDISVAPATQTVSIGATATFTVTVLNNGAQPLANVSVSAPNAPDCQRTFATLALGESQTYTCSFPNVTAYFVNALTATGTSAATGAPVSDTANAEVQINGSTTTTGPAPQIVAVDPFITKSANPPFALPGESVTFTFTITNPGTVVATSVTATDPMPAEVEILSATAPAGNVSINGQNVVFTIDALQPGESITVTIASRVRDSVAVPFVIRNEVCMQAANQAAQRCAEASIISINALPRTGETPMWAIVLRMSMMAVAGLVVVGFGWTVRRTVRR